MKIFNKSSGFYITINSDGFWWLVRDGLIAWNNDPGQWETVKPWSDLLRARAMARDNG